MRDQLQHLTNRLDTIQSPNLSKSFSELNCILEKYTKILDSTNCPNDVYKSVTLSYYPDITTIRDYIQESLYSETPQKKDLAFDKARNELKKDIRALTILLWPEMD